MGRELLGGDDDRAGDPPVAHLLERANERASRMTVGGTDSGAAVDMGPVVSREHLARSGGTARAIVVNSGCANACTGEDGLKVARDTQMRVRVVL